MIHDDVMRPDLWKTLSLIQTELGLDEQKLAAMMGSTAERLKALRDSGNPPTIISLVVLSTFLDIPFTPLSLGKLTSEDLERAKKKLTCQ